MKPTCSNCKKYDSEGYCNLPRVSSRRRKEKPTTWCMEHEQRDRLEQEDSPESTGDYDHREQCVGGYTGPLFTNQTRVEVGRTEVVLCWDDAVEEITVGIFRKGSKIATAVLVAHIPSDRRPGASDELPSEGGSEYAPFVSSERNHSQSADD